MTTGRLHATFDIAGLQAVAQLRYDLSFAAPKARLIETVQARVPLSLLFGLSGDTIRRDARQQEHRHLADHGFRTWSWTSQRPLRLDAFRAVVRDLPTAIYRAKGVLWLGDAPECQSIFQLVGKRSTIEAGDTWSGPPSNALVLIGRGEAFLPAELRRRLEHCQIPIDDPTAATRA